jgi:hypothetical protein
MLLQPRLQLRQHLLRVQVLVALVLGRLTQAQLQVQRWLQAVLQVRLLHRGLPLRVFFGAMRQRGQTRRVRMK